MKIDPVTLHPLRWDIFCRVIDNYGDIGVAWRLAAQLAGRGCIVRLWTDDSTPLSWMAPRGCVGIDVRNWNSPPDTHEAMPDVVVETFGCHAPQWERTRRNAGTRPPTRINLEYLSAEAYAARSHGLASPMRYDDGTHGMRWFYFPGFEPGTGGLLRETDLLGQQAEFDRPMARKALGAATHQCLVTLFCYAPAALPQLAEQLAAQTPSARLLVTPGRSTEAWNQWLASRTVQDRPAQTRPLNAALLSYRTQVEFDRLLWASDLNFVRGEDSLVRALWAGEAFVWQIYPQADDAHHAKLHAFLDWLGAPACLRRFHEIWNGLRDGPLPAWELALWREVAQSARARLMAQPDLLSQLIDFVHEKQ